MPNKNFSLGKIKNKLSVMFFILLVATAITAIAYYLLSNIYYHPGDSAFGGREVFLYPRYFPPANDLPSGVFPLWQKSTQIMLLQYGFIIFAAFITAYFFIYRKVRSLSKFMLCVYLLALLIIFMFLRFTPHGFGHIERQATSINNGMRYAMVKLFSPDKGMWSSPDSRMWTTSAKSLSESVPSGMGKAEVSLIKKLTYLFNTFYGNEVNYTVLGSTHPLGNFAVAFIIFKIASIFPNSAIAWGIIVTLINTITVVIIGLIAGYAFSKRIGKLTAIMMLTIPSVVMHFCAMIDVITSLFTAIGFLIMAITIKKLYSQPEYQTVNFLRLGLLTGLPFFAAAQMNYGNMIPITLSLLSFFVVTFKQIKRLTPYILGLLFLPVVYLVFEFLISSGKSCYPVRAMAVARFVGNYLNFRPYGPSQFANFTVLFVMGGILYLPTIINSVQFTLIAITSFFKRNISANAPANYRRKIRTFLSFIVAGTLFYLLVQKSIRLEVERILHWVFICVWPLMGVYFISLRVVFKRLFNRQISSTLPLLVLGLAQLTLSIVLALCIQDYY